MTVATALPAGGAARTDRGADFVVLDRVSIEFARSRGAGHVIAVSDVSVAIRRGEKFVILGPSGCGKSTLLTALGGFIPVSSGAILV
ncbi:MAG: ATP-binding cassette domain-containing protein, partial [Betaproteobacteria bacterium]